MLYLKAGAVRPVLPTGRNFGRKTQKSPYKNLSGRKKQRLNFSDFSKNARKVAEHFYCVFFT
jgi:hypothetical protein